MCQFSNHISFTIIESIISTSITIRRNRKLIVHETSINCTLVPESTFFLEDISGQLWNLTQNGTVSKFKSQLLFASLNELSFRLPKLRGFGSHLVRPHFHKLDQPTVLDLVSANHQSLQQISQITDVGQGSFLQGLGSLFGIMIRSLAQGGQTIIKAVGNGVNHGFEGKAHLAMTLPQE